MKPTTKFKNTKAKISDLPNKGKMTVDSKKCMNSQLKRHMQTHFKNTIEHDKKVTLEITQKNGLQQKATDTGHTIDKEMNNQKPTRKISTAISKR